MNQSLRDRYSNYYVDTMPLLLDEDDILFTLYSINFANIAKLLEGTSEAVLGVTVLVNIAYEVRFKGLQAKDNIETVVVITNNLEILRNIQDKLEEYFLTFIDNIFKLIDYKFIYTGDSFYNNIDVGFLVWSFIKQELKKKEIKFYDNVTSRTSNNSTFLTTNTLYENNSVLAWAGEGYPEEKLTVENFLKFYKKNMKTYGDYYVRGTVAYFNPNKSRIENLPFAKPDISIYFKTTVSVLVGKEKIDLELQEFSEIVIDFWHYYKLETYYKNYRLVFKMQQNEFDALVESASSLGKKAFTNTFRPIFKPIFNFFEKNKWGSNPNWRINIGDNNVGSKHKINLIKKEGFLL